MQQAPEERTRKRAEEQREIPLVHAPQVRELLKVHQRAHRDDDDRGENGFWQVGEEWREEEHGEHQRRLHKTRRHSNCPYEYKKKLTAVMAPAKTVLAPAW